MWHICLVLYNVLFYNEICQVFQYLLYFFGFAVLAHGYHCIEG